MADRQLQDIAIEQGLTSAQLVKRLEQAGIERKSFGSSVDEEVVLPVLGAAPPGAATNGNGRRNGNGSEPNGSRPSKNGQAKRPAGRSKPSPRPEKDSAPEKAPPPLPRWTAPRERVRLRWRTVQLRRRRRALLEDLGGLTVELHRVGSRRRDLTDERLSSVAAIDEELLRLERRLHPESVGGTCPSCGLHSTRTRYCLGCGGRLPGRFTTAPRMSLPIAALGVVLVAGAWLLGGLGSGKSPAPKRTSAVAQQRVLAAQRAAAAQRRYTSLVASVRGSSIGVYRTPGAPRPATTLDNPNLDGAPLVFLVKRVSGSWALVYLPSRPNGSTGWIRLARVTLAGHQYRALIDLDRHRLTVWNGPKRLLKTPVGVGRAVTPTPAGLYYITELLKQPDPTGIYGPYAFGLSAHSNVLHEFAGRDGILGIHGTDFPRGIGTDVSHGCIRVSNAVITRLAKMLPAGTPVRIVRGGGSSSA
jgi:lipoprotein-anchoring transpeptidase ErfK/SrfK